MQNASKISQDKPPRLLAVIGASGSGKSALAHTLALKHQCAIFSLDSLSIYKGIDIASDKPSVKKREEVRYYGIDELLPNELSNAMIFKDLLEKAISENAKTHKPLLIVGGSSFFLKSIIDGLSPLPAFNEAHLQQLASYGDIQSCYQALQKLDKAHAAGIKPNDTYRIHRALLIYIASNQIPSVYFLSHPKQPFSHHIEVFSLVRDRIWLRKRIAKRTRQMMERGIIDEVAHIAKEYGTQIQSLKAIGTKETLAYLNGEIASKEELENLITTHTCQLAKRQITFNRTQFKNITHLDRDALESMLTRILDAI